MEAALGVSQATAIPLPRELTRDGCWESGERRRTRGIIWRKKITGKPIPTLHRTKRRVKIILTSPNTTLDEKTRSGRPLCGPAPKRLRDPLSTDEFPVPSHSGPGPLSPKCRWGKRPSAFSGLERQPSGGAPRADRGFMEQRGVVRQLLAFFYSKRGDFSAWS